MVIGIGPAGFVNKTKSQRCDGWLDGELSGSFWTLKGTAIRMWGHLEYYIAPRVDWIIFIHLVSIGPAMVANAALQESYMERKKRMALSSI